MTIGMIFKKLFKKPAAIFGIILLIGFAGAAIFAPKIAPVPENSLDEQVMPKSGISSEPKPPDEEHIMGTTADQYDLFYGLVWGTRSAFRIALGITVITTLIGLIVGSISGFIGGWFDEAMMRVTEVFQAIPFLLSAIIMTSVLKFVFEHGEGSIMVSMLQIFSFLIFGETDLGFVTPDQAAFLFTMVSIILFGWMEIARVIRGNILAVKTVEYAAAAKTIGGKNSRILFRHLVPNAIFPLLVMAPMNIGSYVITFATLSFLGVGPQEGYAEWGSMLSIARNWLPSLYKYPQIAFYPGLAIVLFVLAWNFIGDALRDILDPRMMKEI